MSLGTDLLGRTDQAVLELNAFLGSIPIPIDEEAGSFFHVVTVLTRATWNYYFVLRNAFLNNDQTMMAWTCRSLLELAVFAKFVMRSRKDANEFAADRLIDGMEIVVSLKNLAVLLNSVPEVGWFEGTVKEFAEGIKREGITRTKPLSVRELAQEFGMKEKFDCINKICSKFVHPTSWSLFTMDEHGVPHAEGAEETLFVSGAEFTMSVYASIVPHIKKWGLRHAPTGVDPDERKGSQ